MSACPDLVGCHIRGQKAAQRALDDLTATVPDPGLLFEQVLAMVSAGDLEGLRAFMRTLQKHLEAQR